MNAKTSPSAGNTWRDLPAAQQPEYPDTEALRAVIADLESYPPLVFAGECDQLRARMAAVAKGEAFLLQGGDCAEAFDAVSADHIRNKLKTLLQMGAVLTYAASVPVVKVGRIAGQYSKPRSKPTETRDGVTLPTYRGDSVNGFDFTEAARIPDPERLKRMYHASASTLNLVRAFTTGGYADLRQVHAWNQDFGKSLPGSGQRYEQLAREIDNALNFMRACGTDPAEFQTASSSSRSHRGACCCDYESALTRPSRLAAPGSCASPAHMVWIGERTRQLDPRRSIEFASRPPPDRPDSRHARPSTTCRGGRCSASASWPPRSVDAPAAPAVIVRMGARTYGFASSLRLSELRVPSRPLRSAATSRR
ncbi:Phospho-2-dehydro-3-deoxyheptonate aldolase OS=Streptomyces tendae OX=1932 GN=GUR47_11900 PE=3 SV=1 [Streptomyces tendae]